MDSAPGLLAYVNPLQGTDSHYGFSTGNTLPLTAMPFGMNHWSPQTDEGSWFFSPRARKLQGVRLTHQPSPWIGDYGALTILPQAGPRATGAGRRATAYRPDRATFKPHTFRAELIASDIVLEMAPTERGAIFRFSFPEGVESRVILDPARGESFAQVLDDRRTVVGYTRGAAGGVVDGFAHHFVARFDRDILSWAHFAQDSILPDGQSPGERVGIALELGLGGPVLMRIATSFIGPEQALRNLELELGEEPFDTILARAEAAWEANLGRIRVEISDFQELRTFYSCLYRTQLFPRIWHEIGPDGAPIHRSPYDGQVHPGVLYTDNGFWDTYRTEYPLLALLSPARLSEILQGWVNAYKEGGWFPQWASPGYRACMVGTHIDAVMADAVSRGVRGFDVETALEGMLKHAFHPGKEDGSFGRIGIEDYQKLGYVPASHHESVARSLDYAYDDYCIAQVAEALGEGAQALRTRQTHYRNSFDPAVGFMRGRNADGSWQEPWDEFHWGSPYVEGGPWQCLWAVPHDVEGLAELLGGKEAMVAKLDQMLATPPKFTTGAYGMEIHEMTEMACADFGQYAHSNQPVHHVLYLYAALGQPERTQQEVRRVMAEMYSPDHFAGDEDNGEMAAWYVLSALGLFPLCPGDGTWTLGSPLFDRAVVHLEGGGQLTLEAPGADVGSGLVEEVSLNGEPVRGPSIQHALVSQGGTLSFRMRG